MKKDDILNKVQTIFRDVMENDEVEIDVNTSADDVEEWDSLSNVQLVVAIKKAFGINFTSKEMLMWENVGDIVESISEKIK